MNEIKYYDACQTELNKDRSYGDRTFNIHINYTYTYLFKAEQRQYVQLCVLIFTA